MIPGFELLPLEIVSQIFQYLHFRELIAITVVCKEWSNFIWRNFTIFRSARIPFSGIDELHSILFKLDRVQELELHRVADATTLQLIVERFPNLKHLSIRRNLNLTNECLKPLERLEKLESLHISGSWNIRADGIRNIGYHPSLTSIEMRGCDCIDNDAFWCISKQFPNLQLLDARDCGNKIDDVGMMNICENIQGLTYIDLSGTNITDVTIKRISDCYANTLHTLHLWTCKNITDEGIAALTKLSNLEVLNLQDEMLLTDSSFQFLSLLPSIRRLLIGSPLFTDKACENFTSSTLKEMSVFLQEDFLTNETKKQLQHIPIVHWGYFVNEF